MANPIQSLHCPFSVSAWARHSPIPGNPRSVASVQNVIGNPLRSGHKPSQLNVHIPSWLPMGLTQLGFSPDTVNPQSESAKHGLPSQFAAPVCVCLDGSGSLASGFESGPVESDAAGWFGSAPLTGGLSSTGSGFGAGSSGRACGAGAGVRD